VHVQAAKVGARDASDAPIGGDLQAVLAKCDGPADEDCLDDAPRLEPATRGRRRCRMRRWLNCQQQHVYVLHSAHLRCRYQAVVMKAFEQHKSKMAPTPWTAAEVIVAAVHCGRPATRRCPPIDAGRCLLHCGICSTCAALQRPPSRRADFFSCAAHTKRGMCKWAAMSERGQRDASTLTFHAGGGTWHRCF
jgi:hypothetical protein